MITWIMANLGTIIVLAVLVIIVAAVVFGMIRNRKKGIRSCGSCSTCAFASKCSPAKKDE